MTGPTVQNLTFHEGQAWRMTFTAHRADGSVWPLLSGVHLEFQIEDDAGVQKLLLTIGDGINVTNEAGGVAEILVTSGKQTEAGLVLGTYFYEIRLTDGDVISIQAEGELSVEHSLYGATPEPLLEEFRERFPEFTETDGIVNLYLHDAANTVNDAGVAWSDDDRSLATLYVAAHYLQVRLNAKTAHEAGGMETGPVRSIRVEDRSVSYGDPNANLSKTGAGQTYYGQQYLALLRKYPVWLMRA